MGFRETLARGLMGLAVKAAPRPESLVFTVGRGQWTTWNWRAWCEEAYAGNPYVFRATQIIAQAAAGITLWPQIRRRGDWVDMQETHPLQRVLQSPNERQGFADLLEAHILIGLLGGDSYLLGVGPSDNAPPRELWPLTPGDMSPIPGALLGQLDGFELRIKGGTQRVGVNDVFWWHLFSPSSMFIGQPQGQAGARAIDACSAALSYNKAVLDNGGIPGTVLSSEVTLTQDRKAELKETFAAKHEGPRNAGRFLLLDGGLKPFKFGLTPQEMSWQDLITSSAREIALVYGVPPELLGDASQKTFSNYREARSSLYTETVLPLLDRWGGTFARWNQTLYGEEFRFIVDLDTIEALSQRRAEKWAAIRGAYVDGVLTLDEVREEMGWEPVGGAAGTSFRSPSPALQIAGGKASAYPHEHKARRRKRALKPIDHERPSVTMATRGMAKELAAFLRSMRAPYTARLLDAYKGPSKSVESAQDVMDLLALLDEGQWKTLPKALQPYIEGVARDGVRAAGIQVGVTSEEFEDLVKLADPRAINWARDRAAELVGMKWDGDSLVPNPRAEWRIDESTRQDLRQLVTSALEDGWSNDRLAQAIEESASFSAGRAETVARTELAYADSAANQIAWTESGVVKAKVWLLSNDEGTCEICEANAAAGEVAIDAAFPSGDREEPAHPNCRCVTVPVVAST